MRIESATAGAVGRVVGDGGRRTRSPILVVEDHAVFAETLAMAIDAQPDMQCAGIAASVAEGAEHLRERSVEVIVMDVQLPEVDGIEGTRRLRELSPESRVVVLTAHTDAEVIAEAAAAGACGFISKERPLRELLQAIRSGRNGGMIVEPSSLLDILAKARESAAKDAGRPSSYSLITKREHEVLKLMAQGMDVRSVARELGVSIHTSRGHVKSILAKLGVHSQLEAVVRASREGLLGA